jgi:hypothetical protein
MCHNMTHDTIHKVRDTIHNTIHDTIHDMIQMMIHKATHKMIHKMIHRKEITHPINFGATGRHATSAISHLRLAERPAQEVVGRSRHEAAAVAMSAFRA